MSHNFRSFAFATLAALCAFSAPTASAQELRALVIGIDAYADRPLRGAVADARDLADALTSFGAVEITPLIDGAATRKAVLAQWTRLVAASQPGDTLVLTYAGHGGQAPELIAGDEEDRLDEVLLLSGGVDQGLLDNEVYLMLSEAAARGVQVLAIFDTCHSGTIWRSVDAAALRHHPDVPTPALSRSESDRIARAGSGADMMRPPPGVVVIGASQDRQTVPEFPIGGEARGALSHTVARLLRESGPQLAFGDLVQQVRVGVRTIAARHHVPSFAPRDLPADAIVLSRPGDAPAAAQSAESTEPPLMLGFVGASDIQRAAALAHPGTAATSSPDLADLTLDFGCKAARTPELVYSPGLTEATVGRFIDRWRLIRTLQARQGVGVDFRLNTDAPVIPFGEQIGFTSAPPHDPSLSFLTMFAVSGDGAVFGIYPQSASDPLEPAGQRIPAFGLKPKEPAGQDHVVVIWSDGPLDRTHAIIAGANGSNNVGALRDALIADLDDHAAAIGYASVVTGELKLCP